MSVSEPPFSLWNMQPWHQGPRQPGGQQVNEMLVNLEAPPDVLVQAFKAAVNDRENTDYLKERGRELAKFAASKIPGVGKKPSGPPSPPNPWVSGFVSPVLDPVLQGFKEEIQVATTPLLLKAAGAVVGVGMLGFLLGRLSKR